jgi:gamma-glutamyltranspeptidase
LAGRSAVYAPEDAVATSQPLASGAGLEVLLRGGNAIDAAVAAAAVLNVVEPHMTGIGGDMFAILWSAKDQELSGLDASGRAGSLVNPEVLRADGYENMPDSGAASVTVPGAISGWVALLDRHGTMSLAEVLEPAIRIAEEGFPVTPIIARQWLDDLINQRAEWVRPISIDFRGHTVWELPPAGQGVAALQVMKMMETLDLEGMGHNSAPYLHHLIEAKKLAFADLAQYVADRDHMRVSTDQLLDAAYLDGRRALIDPDRAEVRPQPGRALTDTETIYLSVADSGGNMISFINSQYGHFGSGIVVPGTGFTLQNRGAGFTMEDGHPNQVAPGKRPFHTLLPGFVTKDGAPWMTFGLMGGSMQPQGHTQLLLNILVFGMDVQAAIDAPRFRHLDGQRVAIEDPVPEDVRARLRAVGHEVMDGSSSEFGGAQAIIRLDRGWVAGSDPRKDGMAVGR